MALEVKTSTVEKSLIKTLSAHTQNQIHKIHTDDVYPEKKVSNGFAGSVPTQTALRVSYTKWTITPRA